MKVTLIICTYLRPLSLLQLLNSIAKQTQYPDEILIVDGSTDDKTKILLAENNFLNLKYFLVSNENRGLTKQRNFGISKVSGNSEIIAFLDDDTIVTTNYIEELVKTFSNNPEITGVGGVALNENAWNLLDSSKNYSKYCYFKLDGYVYKEGQRNVVRNYLGLNSNLEPGKMPKFSHGRTCGFPMDEKIYEVDLLIGMSMAFRKIVFDSIQFSSYFEGYGLYEDADFSIRALQFGKNVINTKLQLNHYHHPSGRPNQYLYGKMVVRNGWYVWRTKNPVPMFQDKLKWHSITILLLLIRFSNIFTTTNGKEALIEAAGRVAGWCSLLLNKPKTK